MVPTDPIEDLAVTARLRRDLPEPPQRRAIRRDARITAPEMARAVGVSTASVFGWEAGRSDPQGMNRSRYVEALTVLRGVA